jgi:hypothetical protein
MSFIGITLSFKKQVSKLAKSDVPQVPLIDLAYFYFASFADCSRCLMDGSVKEMKIIG